MARILLIWLIFIALLGAQSKLALDHSVYEQWNFITKTAISKDGQWIGYTVGQENRDGVAVIKHINRMDSLIIERGTSVFFSEDNQKAIVQVAIPKDTIRALTLKKVKKKDLPKDSLYIINLLTKEIVKYKNIDKLKLPSKYIKLAAFITKSLSKKNKKEKNNSDSLKVDIKGDSVIVFDLLHFKEKKIPHVGEFEVSGSGSGLVFSQHTDDTLRQLIRFWKLGEESIQDIKHIEGKVLKLGVDLAGEQIAWLQEKDSISTLTYYHLKKNKERLILDDHSELIPDGFQLNKKAELTFSEKGKRLIFGLGKTWPKSMMDSIPKDEQVHVDIWHYQDPYLQPMQLKQLKKEKDRVYHAIYDISGKDVVILESDSLPRVIIGEKGDGKYAVGISNVPYRQLISWDYPSYNDIYRVSLKTGKAERIAENVQDNPVLSPSGRYVAWWDRDQAAWNIADMKSGNINNATQHYSGDLRYDLHDWPYTPDSYGYAGWTRDERYFVIYNKYDLLALDPAGKKAPLNLTEGYGEKHHLRLRWIRTDLENEWIDLSQIQLLSGFHYKTKESGFYKLHKEKNNVSLTQLVYGPKQYRFKVKAQKAETIVFTREDVREFPDLWVSGWDMDQAVRISLVNPQQSQYRWADVRLIHWYSLDGKKLDGLLYVPEDFDPTGQYPMMVYFYEKNSDNLYRHWAPQPHRSIINFTFYASRGYLVFVPDIHYKVGYPGESAVNCVLPGVTSLIEKGFVDKDRIGVQGHSWGGYQIAHLVTRTDIFRAAEAGAPVSNMFSAYGGIRWGTGMSRMFQYEKTQSRIGKTIWSGFLEFLENSPLFWAEKINTPLLIMHNDHDGAVPWYQGIELFVALRRLGKPTWLINYNDAPHWPITFQAKKDWAIRMQQYFDHFLKDAPAPVWLKEGVPATLKGTTMGYELTQ